MEEELLEKEIQNETNIVPQKETTKANITFETAMKKYVFPIKTVIIIGIIAVVLIFAVITAIIIANRKPSGTKSEKTLNVATTITGIERISELYVADFVHKGITIWYDEEYDPAVYIYYSSVAKFGIDVSQIRYSIDEKTKIVTYSLPKPEIKGINIDAGKWKYVYVSKTAKSKYGQFSDSSQASKLYKICEEDAKYEIQKDSYNYKFAEENLLNAVNGYLEPLFKYANGYSYRVVVGGEEE